MTIRSQKNALEKFRTEDEQTMKLLIVLAPQLGNWIAAGDQGDRDARATVISVYDWMKQADEAIEQGGIPGCGYCEDDLQRGRVGGWAVLLPTSEGVGIVAAYCLHCIRRRNRRELSDHFIERARREFNIGLLREQ
jgi:hypothetical protein